jgi:acetolactate decarboxylase
MNKNYFYLILFFLSQSASSLKSQTTNDGIFYSSLNYSVRLGQLDGLVSLKELRKYGDFGVGGEHALAGEMVYVNGIAYRFTADGKAERMPDNAMLAFAAVKFFKPENKWTINKPLTMAQLQQYMDSIINTSLFAAIKITGSFRSIQYKDYVQQQKPYTPVVNAAAKIFDSTNIKGTLVGFFTPKAAMVLNPNYHFHFVNTYSTSGGHVVDYLIENATIEIDYADMLQVKLPPAEAMKDVKLNEPFVPY